MAPSDLDPVPTDVFSGLVDGLEDGLNPAQVDAVTHPTGPLLVVAGAGSGKTRVLTRRIAHLIADRGVSPFAILAITFTNKAASEMKERVAALLDRPVEGWWVGTFHALGARILRSHAEACGLKSNFTILNADDQVRLIKQLLESHDIDEKKWPPRVLSGIIQRWKDRGLIPDKVPEDEAGIVAGGAAGKMRGGRHIQYDKPTPLANLHLSLLNKVGVPMESFADSTGTVDELFEPLSI